MTKERLTVVIVSSALFALGFIGLKEAGRNEAVSKSGTQKVDALSLAVGSQGRVVRPDVPTGRATQDSTRVKSNSEHRRQGYVVLEKNEKNKRIEENLRRARAADCAIVLGRELNLSADQTARLQEILATGIPPYSIFKEVLGAPSISDDAKLEMEKRIEININAEFGPQGAAAFDAYISNIKIDDIIGEVAYASLYGDAALTQKQGDALRDLLANASSHETFVVDPSKINWADIQERASVILNKEQAIILSSLIAKMSFDREYQNLTGQQSPRYLPGL